MKRIYLLSALFGVITSNAQHPAPPPGLGTTHFVVGAPQAGKPLSSIPTLDAPMVMPPGPLKPSTVKPCLSYGPFSCASDGSLHQVFFSPEDALHDKLIYLIDHELKDIKVAIFTMTERSIADALVRALKRGVTLTVLVDPVCIKDRYNKVGILCDAGVCTYVYNPQHVKQGLHSCMHHKFAIFSQNIGNKKVVWTGSFNFTRSASLSNHENALVLDNAAVVQRFEDRFNIIRTQSYRYKKDKKNHALA